tara:strand:+ start:2625 stop:2828 length:204 start_codon:yes stop_codon:yes gene_type:complete
MSDDDTEIITEREIFEVSDIFLSGDSIDSMVNQGLVTLTDKGTYIFTEEGTDVLFEYILAMRSGQIH